MNTKIALSALSIFSALALVGGATFAFFSDVETSTGNTFTAGGIDLKIDNTSYYNRLLSEDTSWTESDLNGQLFFKFNDVKPGDEGEDTISLHVVDNDAWACLDFTTTTNDDVSCTESEQPDDSLCQEPNQDPFDGDLAQALNFIFWIDDGDNVFELGEDILTEGPAPQVLNSKLALADSSTSPLGGLGEREEPLPLLRSNTYYIGKAWCFGELTPRPLLQDGFNNVRTPAGPEGTGVFCDGASVNNAAQTDSLRGDVTFTAEQWRNNPNFQCNPEPTPTPTEVP